MALWLKQSTSVDVKIGPFVDSGDAVTAESALTLTQPDIRLAKNSGAWAQKAAAQTLGHEENGWYELTLDATDTNTLGILKVAVHESGALPVFHDFMVLPANVYDSIVLGTDKLDTNLAEWLGTAPATPSIAGVPEVDVTAIFGLPFAAEILAYHYGGMLAGYGAADSGGTTTVVDTALTQTTDYWVDQWLFCATGDNAGLARRITAFNAGTDTLTTEAFPAAWLGGDTYIILPAGTAKLSATTHAGAIIPTVSSVTALANDAITAAAIAADAGPELATAMLDLAAGVETGLTLRQAIRLMVAALAGKLSGAATTTIVIRNTGDDKDRITATVDASGNRSAIATDLT